MTKMKNLGNALKLAALATASALTFPGAADAAGPIRPFYGNIRPFYGNIRPFYGNIRPFYGNIRPFWGNIRPFWGETGAFYGDLSTFWATSNPVVGTGAPDYRLVGDFWTVNGATWDRAFNNLYNSSSPNYAAGLADVNSVIANSRSFWGDAVRARTGKSFDEGFLNPFLAAHGLDMNNPGSFATLDRDEAAYLFIEYYDALMDYTGTDHVDHWMKTVNWTPALTRTQGSGADSVVGILDQTLTGDAVTSYVTQFTGSSTFSDGHGNAVASLIVGAHDGRGTMGIAPNAQVIGYNPFDADGTADWNDITLGIRRLKASGASVVNVSLGVPGKTFDPGWNGVFANLATTLTLKNTVFVIAAGNEGVSQTGKINWMVTNPAILLVGSVGLDERISNFSNRPGSACLSLLGLVCTTYLKDRFLVAPGEVVLVSDGHGGVTRMSGTSFAAPLVSGAITLLHDRWPWLANYPNETANIILESAKDLGAPGVDEVYGHGLLDVEASQSPLDFNDLQWFSVSNGKVVMKTRQAVISSYKEANTPPYVARDAYYYAFEPLGLLTKRDFAIPLTNKLIGQNVTTYMGAQEQFQAYLLARMGAWVQTQTHSGRFANAGGGFFTATTKVANPWGADLTLSVAPRARHEGFRDEAPGYTSAFRLTADRGALTFGFGDGAAALTSQPGFTTAADYDAEKGGANPLLGFASGGAYAGASFDLAKNLTFSAATLARSEERDTRLLPGLGVVGNGAARYAADAQVMSLAWKPSAELTFSAGWTHLTEATGLLGVQSLDPSDLAHGSTTDGYSLGVAWQPSANLSFAASGTLGRTRAADASTQALTVAKGGLTTSAFEVAATASNLFAKGDRARLALSQPLYIERGALQIQQVEVIDRSTGELGIATSRHAISDARTLAAEALYGLPMDSGRGDLTFFGRAETTVSGAQAKPAEYIAGARYRIGF